MKVASLCSSLCAVFLSVLAFSVSSPAQGQSRREVVSPAENFALYKNVIEKLVEHFNDDPSPNPITLDSLGKSHKDFLVVLLRDQKESRYYTLYLIDSKAALSREVIDIYVNVDAGMEGFMLEDSPQFGLHVFARLADIQDPRLALPPAQSYADGESQRLAYEYSRMTFDQGVHPAVAERRAHVEARRIQDGLARYEDSRLKLIDDATNERWRLRQNLIRHATPFEWVLNAMTRRRSCSELLGRELSSG